MAERRMFAKKIVNDDRFTALPSSAQALYLQLAMAADDDGFINQLGVSMFRAHADKDDLEKLINAKYVIRFESGVLVIKHWRMMNTLRTDRYTKTDFTEERERLRVKKSGAYTLEADGDPLDAKMATSGNQDGNHMATTGNQYGNQVVPQYSIGQISIVQDSIDQRSEGRNEEDTVLPTLEDVKRLCIDEGLQVRPGSVLSYFDDNNWTIDGLPINDWKEAVREYARRGK